MRKRIPDTHTPGGRGSATNMIGGVHTQPRLSHVNIQLIILDIPFNLALPHHPIDPHVARKHTKQDRNLPDTVPETAAELRRILQRVNLRSWLPDVLCPQPPPETSDDHDASYHFFCHEVVDEALMASPPYVHATIFLGAGIDTMIARYTEHKRINLSPLQQWGTTGQWAPAIPSGDTVRVGKYKRLWMCCVPQPDAVKPGAPHFVY